MSYSSSTEPKFFGLNMWQQVLLGLVLGVAAGVWMGKEAESFKVVGTIFIKLIKMVVVPLIFFALTTGITSLTDGKQFKGIVFKGTTAYLLTSLMAVTFGLVLGHFFEPGLGMPLPPEDTVSPVTVTPPGIKDFLLGLIPGNIIYAMAEDMYLQVVIFAIFTGIVINSLPENTDKIRELNQQMAKVTFRMIEWIVRMAPLAVFGFIASMVGTTGMDVIISLTRLVVLVVATCFFQYLVFGVMIVVFARMSPLPFYRKMINTQVMAFSTSSSKATLATAMSELQNKIGVSKTSTNFVMPLGACINMDGTAIYLGICAMFFSQMYGIALEATDYLMLVLTCTLGSIGAAGVPSGSIIFMGMVLSSVGIPMEGIAIILGVDRILDMFRTTVNITGDAAITMIVDKSEGGLDEEVYYSKLK